MVLGSFFPKLFFVEYFLIFYVDVAFWLFYRYFMRIAVEASGFCQAISGSFVFAVPRHISGV